MGVLGAPLLRSSFHTGTLMAPTKIATCGSKSIHATQTPLCLPFYPCYLLPITPFFSLVLTSLRRSLGGSFVVLHMCDIFWLPDPSRHGLPLVSPTALPKRSFFTFFSSNIGNLLSGLPPPIHSRKPLSNTSVSTPWPQVSFPLFTHFRIIDHLSFYFPIWLSGNGTWKLRVTWQTGARPSLLLLSVYLTLPP